MTGVVEEGRGRKGKLRSGKKVKEWRWKGSAAAGPCTLACDKPANHKCVTQRKVGQQACDQIAPKFQTPIFTFQNGVTLAAHRWSLCKPHTLFSTTPDRFQIHSDRGVLWFLNTQWFKLEPYFPPGSAIARLSKCHVYSSGIPVTVINSRLDRFVSLVLEILRPLLCLYNLTCSWAGSAIDWSPAF